MRQVLTLRQIYFSSRPSAKYSYYPAKQVLNSTLQAPVKYGRQIHHVHFLQDLRASTHETFPPGAAHPKPAFLSCTEAHFKSNANQKR